MAKASCVKIHHPAKDDHVKPHLAAYGYMDHTQFKNGVVGHVITPSGKKHEGKRLNHPDPDCWVLLFYLEEPGKHKLSVHASGDDKDIDSLEFAVSHAIAIQPLLNFIAPASGGRVNRSFSATGTSIFTGTPSGNVDNNANWVGTNPVNGPNWVLSFMVNVVGAHTLFVQVPATDGSGNIDASSEPITVVAGT